MSAFLIRLQQRLYRNRSVTFTSPGTRFVLLTLAVGIAAINTGNNLLYLIVGMMLSLIIISGILSEQSLRRIMIEWGFPNRIFARQRVMAHVRITNSKKQLPSFSFHVEEMESSALSLYVFKLSARQSTAVSYPTVFTKRGYRFLPSLVLRTTFPFGFFHKSLIRPQDQQILIYPRILPSGLRLGTRMSETGYSKERRQRGKGSVLHSLRDYTSADDARDIHWKASARESKLLLKEYEREEDRRITIYLSNHLPSSSRAASGAPVAEDFERAIEIAASLGVSFSRRGFPVGLQTLTNGRGPDRLPPDQPQDLDKLLKTLALLESVEGLTPEWFSRKTSGITDSDSTGRYRILILPGPDPLWDPIRHCFSEVLVASEPRFKEWQIQGEIEP